MRVTWSEEAREAVRETSDYIWSEFGAKAKRKFLQEIGRIGSLLQKNPNLGQFEYYLKDCPEHYRSIVVNRLNKIVYYIHDNCVDIVAFWDTRREPKEQAKEVK